MSSLLHGLLNLPGWLVLLTAGTLVLVEDALFVGFVIPGETAAVLTGVVATQGHLPLWAAILVIVAAAVVGDSLGYEVGRKWGTRALDSTRLDRFRDRIDGGRDLLARRGGSAVFLGRFVALFRALMPALAGTARLPYRTFLAWNALGGIAWGVGAVLIGYLAGTSYEQVVGVVGKAAALVVLALALLAFVAWRINSRRTAARDAT